MYDYHTCFNDYQNIKRMSKAYEESQKSKDGTLLYDINQVVTVDKDMLGNILRDEMMNNLLTVLGINEFNKWYIETHGGPAPFIWIKPKSSKGVRKRYYNQKYHILNEEDLTKSKNK
tara:strand:+ start:10331 stop:10681 length:351 start_codon:yes stop_codon:yes gene_type:complete